MDETMPQRAMHYELEYIESQVRDSELIVATAEKRLRFWHEMLRAKHALLAGVDS